MYAWNYFIIIVTNNEVIRSYIYIPFYVILVTNVSNVRGLSSTPNKFPHFTDERTE